MTKTTKIVLISVGVLALAGTAYYFYSKNKTEGEATPEKKLKRKVQFVKDKIVANK